MPEPTAPLAGRTVTESQVRLFCARVGIAYPPARNRFSAVADLTAGLGDYPASVRCAANPGPVEPAAPALVADRPSITHAAETGEGGQPSSTSPAFLPLIRPGTSRPYLPASVRPGGSEDRDGAASDYDVIDGEEADR